MSALLDRLARAVPAVGNWARGAWCRRQRRRLVGGSTTVIWIPRDKVPWALWGAEHHFFDADWAGGLMYLRGR